MNRFIRTNVGLSASLFLLAWTLNSTVQADDAETPPSGANNPCLETGSWSCLTPGGYTTEELQGDTEFTICINGSITPPDINVETSGWEEENDFECASTPGYGETRQGEYDVETWWEPSDPSIPGTFPEAGTFPFTAKAKAKSGSSCPDLDEIVVGTITVVVLGLGPKPEGCYELDDNCEWVEYKPDCTAEENTVTASQLKLMALVNRLAWLELELSKMHRYCACANNPLMCIFIPIDPRPFPDDPCGEIDDLEKKIEQTNKEIEDTMEKLKVELKDLEDCLNCRQGGI